MPPPSRALSFIHSTYKCGISQICPSLWYLSKAKIHLYIPRRTIVAIPNSGESLRRLLSMNFITRLPRSRGFEAILVIVDSLTKDTHFVQLKHSYSARMIAEAFVKVARLHGIPNLVVSDRDPLFMSSFRKEFFQNIGDFVEDEYNISSSINRQKWLIDALKLICNFLLWHGYHGQNFGSTPHFMTQ